MQADPGTGVTQRFHRAGEKQAAIPNLFSGSGFSHGELFIGESAAWVNEMKTKVKVEFPVSRITKEVQVKAFEMLSLLRT